MIVPTIHFSGECEEALLFYEDVFDATDKNISYYREAPTNSSIAVTQDTKDYVLHSSMSIRGTKFNFSDSSEDIIAGNMFCFNIFYDSIEEVKSAFHKLKIGGDVIVELGPQFFSDMYGSIIDKFGVKWQLIYGNV